MKTDGHGVPYATDRERMKEMLEEEGCIDSVTDVGNGFRVSFGLGKFQEVTPFLRSHGWFVAGVHWNEKVVLLAPIGVVL